MNTETSHFVHDQELPRSVEERQTALLDFLTACRRRPALMEGLQVLLEKQPTLLHGDHYWRTISENGTEFSLPANFDTRSADVIAFSRIANKKEILCAINLNDLHQAEVYVTLDNSLHPSGSRMTCLYASASSPGELNVEDRNGKAIRLTIPPRALVIYG